MGYGSVEKKLTQLLEKQRLKLTNTETELLERRRTEFDAFFSEMMPVLADFVERMGLPHPAMVVAEPELFVDGVSDFFSNQVIADEDRVWAITRIGYFIGELLNKRLGGCWYVNTEPNSPNFSRYVVGRFSRCANKQLSIDPMAAASQFLSEPSGRDFVQLVTDIETELHSRDAATEKI